MLGAGVRRRRRCPSQLGNVHPHTGNRRARTSGCPGCDGTVRIFSSGRRAGQAWPAQGVAPMRLWPASARWRWRGCSRGRSRAERECVAVAIDGSGLLVCHDSTVNGDRNFTVLEGLTRCGVDPDDGLTCSSKRLQRTVTQNRHFNEQAEFVTRQGAHPDSCPRWRRSLSGPSCPRRGEYAGATGWVLMVGTTVSRVRSAGTVS